MLFSELTITSHTTVSRLYGHSKNYDMDLTLDYNVELFPLQKEQNFALALASSLSRGPSGGNADGSAEDERDVWRPDGKGSRGLEDDYDYVMYGKVGIFCRSFYFSTQYFVC
jgi:DNA-directed RNA polymerase I, II, and III subunit RPABC3